MPPGVVLLFRHGQTQWSHEGRHTGVSDVPLDPTGEQQARAIARLLAGAAGAGEGGRRSFAMVLTSPLHRARRTAELAGFPAAQTDPDLAEWNYGAYEGLTSAEIALRRPGWYLWDDGVPDGESLAHLGERADRVLDRVAPILLHGDVAIFGHGHALRVLAARWLGQPPRLAGQLKLDSGRFSELGFEHDRRVLAVWNAAC